LADDTGEDRFRRHLPVRDENAALRAVGGDAALADELIEALVAQLPGELSLLGSLVGAGDCEGIDDLAHRLRGATAYCGVTALEDALADLSRAAKSCAPERLREAARGVAREVRRLRELKPEGAGLKQGGVGNER
jgi:HPt (histidine-containing phosphotransfer) domain-containing protein